MAGMGEDPLDNKEYQRMRTCRTISILAIAGLPVAPASAQATEWDHSW